MIQEKPALFLKIWESISIESCGFLFPHFADTIQIFERLNDGGSITMTLAENGVKTVGITIKNEALEDYYLNLTGGALNV